MNIKYVVLIGIFAWGVPLLGMNSLVEEKLGTRLPSILKKLESATLEDAWKVLGTYGTVCSVRQRLEEQLSKKKDVQVALEQMVKNIVKTADEYEKEQAQKKASIVLIAGGIAVRAMVDEIVQAEQGKEPLSSLTESVLNLEGIKVSEMEITPDLGYFDRERKILGDLYKEWNGKKISDEDKKSAFAVILEDLDALREEENRFNRPEFRRGCETLRLLSGVQEPCCFMRRLKKNTYVVQLPARMQETLDCGFRAFVASLFFAQCADLPVLVKCLASEGFEACVSKLKKAIKEARVVALKDEGEIVEWLESEELEILTGQSLHDVIKVRQGEWPLEVKTPYGARKIVIKLTAGEKIEGLVTAGNHYFVECTDINKGQPEMVFVHDSFSRVEAKGMVKVQDRLVSLYKKKGFLKPLLPTLE